MTLLTRITKLERTSNERGCTACSVERVVIVPDLEAARDPTLKRCQRCGRDINDRIKILVGDCWSAI